MPTVLRIGSLRFYFYSHEPNEPAHVHVDKDSATAKIWLHDRSVGSSIGFASHELRNLQRHVDEHHKTLREAWELTLKSENDIRVMNVRIDDDTLTVSLMDGRAISVPIAWFPRRANGSPAQRQNWQISGAGYCLHWPELDEDLSTEGLLRGIKGVSP